MSEHGPGGDRPPGSGLRSWLLGLALGVFVGGLGLEIGTLILVLLVPTLVWAAVDHARPLGLGGLLVGTGTAVGGLIAWADARCRADPSCYIPDDHTPWFVFAGMLVLTGTAVTIVAARRRNANPNANARS